MKQTLATRKVDTTKNRDLKTWLAVRRKFRKFLLRPEPYGIDLSRIWMNTLRIKELHNPKVFERVSDQKQEFQGFLNEVAQNKREKRKLMNEVNEQCSEQEIGAFNHKFMKPTVIGTFLLMTAGFMCDTFGLRATGIGLVLGGVGLILIYGAKQTIREFWPANKEKVKQIIEKINSLTNDFAKFTREMEKEGKLKK